MNHISDECGYRWHDKEAGQDRARQGQLHAAQGEQPSHEVRPIPRYRPEPR